MNLDRIRNERLSTILQFSVPSIAAMVLTSLITVVDGFFIGNYVGKEGLAAVNLGLPVVYLYLAVGLMISVGGVAIAGMSLGGGDPQRAAAVFQQTLWTASAAVAALSFAVWFCFDPMLRFLHADPQVSVFFKDYYGVLLLELPVMVINSSFGMFIRGEGRPEYFMKINVLNVLLNFLLDYLFVSRFGWGVSGVAAASLIAALVTLFGAVRFFLREAAVYRFCRFDFSGEVLRDTLLNGSSEFIGEISLCVSMFAYNFVILKNIGVDGVTAFTIVGYLAYLFSMVVIGFGQGASPLISFVYGTMEIPLAISIRKITNILVFIAGAGVLLLVCGGCGWYGGLFVKSGAVEQLVRSGVVIFAISFLFSGVNTISSFYFTSIGRAMESAVISFSRGLVLLLLFIFTLPALWGMTGVWLVAPVTEALTLLISLFFIGRERKNLPAGQA